MSLKTQIRLGVFIMLGLLLSLGSYVLVTIHRLETEAPSVQQTNALAAQRAVYLFLLISTLLGIVLMVRLPRLVTRPLTRLTADVERVAAPGPVTRVAVTRNNEVGHVAAAVNRVLRQAEDERRATLAELITQRNRTDSLVRGLDEGLLLIDQHGLIVLANPVACLLLGQPAKALLDQPAAEVARHNEMLREWLRTLDAPAASPTPTDQSEASRPAGPVFMVRPHGENLHYQLTVSEVTELNEELQKAVPAGHVFCLRDVSAFKNLDQVKSEFLATISHELKTPLASINLSLMLLQDERLTAERRQEIAGGIRSETQRLLGMVGQLIEISRLDAGKEIRLNLAPVPLPEVVRYATDIVRAQLTDKDLRLAVHLAEPLPCAQADVEKTTWVLINLLSNAIRYSPHGAALTIRVVPWGEMVQLSVEDQGPGIAKEYHQRIFQRFGGVLGPAGQQRGSSGLGLSISREFITAQGGQLWVESQPGAGSCFTFTLPAAG
ncbi:PAS domain-containing protein [Hymenobacter sp. BRD128]|uniref:sensor histidine kinase n=1 Tax=Hymenobacter sp. BRD128 TaxID=2675878 RepID=UPI0015644EAC|nr:ATP-binding protein [Hymenobacter sp. BRD128]QKG55741.1 PAS domain-containing protein [Hymenobacter sp. BRD128]